MTARSLFEAPGMLAVVVVLAVSGPARGQNENGTGAAWSPPRLADGQPDIQGMWNSVDAVLTPLELPDELGGRTDLSPEELQARTDARKRSRIENSEWHGFDSSRGVGAYGTHWFDWYWRDPVAGDAPALVVDPPSGRIPDWTPAAHEVLAHNREHLHDSYEYMESGDRCITRGVLGMMMPTEYNNGKLILQPPGYVVLHSEMIHNARIIPIDRSPHLPASIRQWDGDPRGRWEGNTLVVESTNFKPVRSMRGALASIRSRQSEKQRIVERFTIVDANTLKYSISIEDHETYTAPWRVAFPLRRDHEYRQFEYACHEGNYSVPNALNGARVEEKKAGR